MNADRVLQFSDVELRSLGKSLVRVRRNRLAFTALLAPPEFQGQEVLRWTHEMKANGDAIVTGEPLAAPWFIGLAEERMAGYWPEPGFGFYATEAEARKRADDLNRSMFGLSPRDAIAIVLSSMGAGSPRSDPDPLEDL